MTPRARREPSLKFNPSRGGISNEGQRANVLGATAEAQAVRGDIGGGLSSARRINDERQRASALGVIAAAQAQAGDTQGAAGTIGEAQSAARRISDDGQRAWALSHIARAQILAQVGQAIAAAAQSTAPAASSRNASADERLAGCKFELAAIQSRYSKTEGDLILHNRCDKAVPDYVRSSCSRLHTGTGTGFGPLTWRRAAHSDRFGARCTLPSAQSTRSIEQDELVESRGGAPCRRHEGVTVAGGFRSMPVPQSRP